ncbi:CD109 antigen-like [Paramacrobiotus metropolitanus]|uniref:CD109 antigen-like n=1 Tax=Paramacrobiotus metropolitanus TaxID=2943436 RepID=UPI002445F8A6|nr:CD109 antigen-like [Paramacrobiotus metropolitanus]
MGSYFLTQGQTYFIAASKKLYSGQPYKIHVSLLQDAPGALFMKASVSSNFSTIAVGKRLFMPGSHDLLLLKVHNYVHAEDYELILEGRFENVSRAGAFKHRRPLELEDRSVHILLRLEKPIYRQDELVRFRVILLTPQLTPYRGVVDVHIYNPDGYLQRRYPSLHSIFGVVSVAYQLAPELKFGDWKIKATIGTNAAEVSFPVEEFNQPLFEVNVTLPVSIIDTEEFLHGSVETNFTWGQSTNGELKLHAFVIDPADGEAEAPDWKGEPNEQTTQFVGFFNGTHSFKFAMADLKSVSANGSVDGKTIGIRATVWDHWHNETRVGYSQTRVYNDSLRLVFLGHKPQVFKPGMVFKTQLAVSQQDGSYIKKPSGIELRIEYILESGSSGQTETWPLRAPLDGMIHLEIPTPKGVSQIVLEAMSTGATPHLPLPFDSANVSKTKMVVLRAQSPRAAYIQVSTHTLKFLVGHYGIFNVRASYFLPDIVWIVTSKGLVLLSGYEEVRSLSYTFSIAITPEMAPRAHLVVFNVLPTGEVIADKYTFPVDGISRHKMRMAVNHHKDYYKRTFEVVAKGDPLAFVGFSAIENNLFSQAPGISSLSRSDLLRSLNSLFPDRYGSALHSTTFISSDGFSDRSFYFGSNTYGLDVESTFSHADLLVFTDATLTQIATDYCDPGKNEISCVSGGCYNEEQKCNGLWDCRDGSDEGGCDAMETFYDDVLSFRRTRYNHIDRAYAFACCWTDGNISPEGHLIVQVPMPDRPAHYVISAVSMSETSGLGLLEYELVFDSIKPFHMIVETPDTVHQGEIIGIRCALFNYYHQEVEVLVILSGSPDYMFVEVGPLGWTHSYYATKVGGADIHHSIWMDSQTQTIVYFPIVPSRLGEISVTITAATQIDEYVQNRIINVIPDGVKLKFHTSIPLDLTNKGTILKLMDIQVTENYTVPRQIERLFVANSPKVTVTAAGDVLGPLLRDSIDSITMMDIAHQGGEMSVFSFAMNLYTLDFLRRTNQLTDEIRKHLFAALNSFYQTIGNYQDYYGPFHQFMNETRLENSVWLTAFAVQVLEESRKVLQYSDWDNQFYADPLTTDQSVRWIIQHQTEEGSFYEPWLAPFDRKMSYHTWQPSGWMENRNITLTAHVVICLQEITAFSSGLGALISTSRLSAVKYLERWLDLLYDPYEISIVTYALTIADSAFKDTAFEKLDYLKQHYDAYLFWGKDSIQPPGFVLRNNQPYMLPHIPHKFESTNIAATAYALMVYNLRRSFLSDRIAAWLNTQRLHDTGFSSTQDTYIAVKALMLHSYFANVREATNINITLRYSSSPGAEDTLAIRKDTLSQIQTAEVPNPWGMITAIARGTGYAVLQLNVEYTVDKMRYLLPPPVKAFDIFMDVTYTGKNVSILILRPCARWTLMEESPQSGMALIEVDIPSGYIVFQPDLEDYCGSQPNHLLRYAEFYNGKVTFFLDYLDGGLTCVDVVATRWYPVANMTRFLTVKVFDYYAPERFNTSIYEAVPLYSLSICHVCGSFQCPYCPSYNHAQLIFQFIQWLWLEVLFFFVYATL